MRDHARPVGFPPHGHPPDLPARVRRLPVYGLTREDVITIIETAREPFEQGAETIVYTAYLGGVEYGVVVKRDTARLSSSPCTRSTTKGAHNA
jgi:hypothetical protein